MGRRDRSAPSAHVECLGLRYALPYLSTGTTYLKDRFEGQPLSYVLGQMFRVRDRSDAAASEVWAREIRAGRVEYRGAKRSREDPWEWVSASAPDRPVGRGSSVRLTRHVHERAVGAEAARPAVLLETADVLAICKPAGIATIDESGGTGTNSLATMVGEMLREREGGEEEGGAGPPRNPTPAHRLDKPVSGVLMMGKSPKKAMRLLQKIQRKDEGVEKVYIARVGRGSGTGALSDAGPAAAGAAVSIGAEDGPRAAAGPAAVPDDFPSRVTVYAELGWDSRGDRAAVLGADEAADKAEKRRMRLIEAGTRARRKEEKRRLLGGKDLPLGECEGGLAASAAAASAPAALPPSNETRTEFRRLGDVLTDGTVLVECRPRGGQRHQIRAHLSLLGWPIANDKRYGGDGGDGDGDGGGPVSSPAAPAPYCDDGDGTLFNAFAGNEGLLLPWCATCRYIARRLVAQEVERPRGETRDLVLDPWLEAILAGGEAGGEEARAADALRTEVDSEIWLRSIRYRIPAAGLDIQAQVPTWAASAEAAIKETIFAEAKP